MAARTTSSTTTDYKAAIEDITAEGVAAIRGARDRVEDTVEAVTDKGREALDGARDGLESVERFVMQSIRTRPYTTLAVAGLIGFAYGALRRR